MNKLLKKTSAMALIIIGLSVTLTGCGTEADNSSMRNLSSVAATLR